MVLFAGVSVTEIVWVVLPGDPSGEVRLGSLALSLCLL
jgi:hypothetical protein